MSKTSYIRGLIGKEQYQETTIDGFEKARAEDLRSGDEKPLTGFEIHFLKCCRGDANPACPKEKALLDATSPSANWATDDDVDYSQFDPQKEKDDDYEREQIMLQFWEDTIAFARASSGGGWYYED